MYEHRAVSRRRFEALVRRALRGLPPEFAGRLENIDIVVRARASEDQTRRPRAATVWGAQNVYRDCCSFANPEPWRQEGNHYWLNDGYATYISVP